MISNDVVFHFVQDAYGVAFACLGIVVLVLPRGHTHLLIIKGSRWLGVFALLQGLQNYIDSTYLNFDVQPPYFLSLAMSTASLLSLVEFGRRSWNLARPPFPLTANMVYSLVLAGGACCAIALQSGAAGLAVAGRYCVGAPGAVLVAASLYRRLRQLIRSGARSNGRDALSVSALAFLAYAFLILFVPADPALHAWIPTEDGFSAFFGIPIQIPKTLCALVLLAALSIALRQSSRITSDALRRVFEVVDAFVYICAGRRNGPVTFLHGTVEAITGYSRDRFFGPSAIRYTNLIHPDDAERVASEIEKALEEGRPFDVGYRIRHRCGETRWVYESGRMLSGEAGGRKAFEGFVVDGTSRRRSEEALQQANATAERTKQLAHIGSWELDIGTGNRTWSPEMYRLFEYKPTVSATFDAAMARIHEDDRTLVREVFQKAIDGAPSEPIEFRMVLPSGKNRHVYAEAGVIYDDENRPLRIYGYVQDMTRLRSTESALRRSETRLRTILDSSPECVKLVDKDGTLLEINPAGLRLVEADSLDEVLGKDIAERVVPAHRFQFREGIARVFQGESTIQSFQIQTLRGATRWMEQNAVPLNDPDAPGRIVAMLAVTRDISGRVQAEAALRRERDFAARLIESAPVIVLLLDPSGRIQMVNPYLERLSGYTAAEVLQRDWFETFLPEEDREPIRELFNRAWGARRIFGNINPIRTKAGKLVDVEWYDAVVFDANASETRLLAIGQDVSSRKEAEKALQVFASRLSQAQRIARIGNWELDLETNSLFWSNEVFEIFELEHDTFRPSYEAFLAAIHPEDRAAVDDAYSKSLQNRTPYRITHRLVMPDGRTKHVEEQCETEFDDAGKPLVSRGTIQDVTEKIIGEQEILRALREKETLLHEIHHRVKNNLQLIGSVLYFQGMKDIEPAARVALEEVNDRLKAMVLVHEKLYQSQTLSQIEFGDYIESLLNQLAQSLRFEERGISWTCHYVPCLAPIDTVLPAGMILTELVTNSGKYAFPNNEGGHVEVALTRHNGSMTLLVNDDGIGLPEDFSWDTATTFGWRLVKTLTGQIGGDLQLRPGGGVNVQIRMRLNAAGKSGRLCS